MTLDEEVAQLEDWATAIARLGIPDYETWNDAPRNSPQKHCGQTQSEPARHLTHEHTSTPAR
ncbi:MAG TPA: hypothetical protein VMQ56_02585 [Terracidiphilus sp.]|jgi:hypothetical protein|nr:hypothetical protein [Terracidiphilus sp.]